MRALLVLALLAVPARAGHELVELESPARITYRVRRDLDGDGLDDLMIVTGREAWLWRGRAGAFPRAPDTKMQLPDGTAFFDVGPAGAAKQGLVARTAGAYWSVSPGAGPVRLPQASGAGLPEHPGNLLWRGFFRDFDRDGETDFLDVSLRGFLIAFGGGGAVLLPPRLMESIDTRGAESSERLVARYAIADWTEGDFDGDGRPDFAVLTARGLLVYSGDGQGRFDASRSREIAIEEARDADLSFLDLNGDGQTDVLALQRKAGRTTILVADAERGLVAPHRIRLAIPGELRLAVVADLDGDGRLDLALPFTSRPSVQAGVRAIVRGEAILKVPIFLNRGGRDCIGARADAQFAFPVRLRITTDSTGRIQLGGLVVVEYRGDLDGDGRTDLLVTKTSTELGLHRGVKEGVFEREASRRIPIADCAEYDAVHTAAANLNGDDQSDIILHYASDGRRPDRLFLLLSGKE